MLHSYHSSSLALFNENRTGKLDSNKLEEPYLDAFMK